MKPEDEDQIDWEVTTWEGNRRSQIEHWAKLSLDEIFAAQEEMAEFARALGSLRDKSPLGNRDCLARDEC